MNPSIRNGDRVVVIPAEAKGLRVGDIAMFKTDDEAVIIHRVVRKTIDGGEPLLLARGDAVVRFTERVSPRHVMGRVIGIEREGRRLRLDRWHDHLLGLIRIASHKPRLLACTVARGMGARRRLAPR